MCARVFDARLLRRIVIAGALLAAASWNPSAAQHKERTGKEFPQDPWKQLWGAAGAVFESVHARRDPLANHWVVDGNLVTGQNQNAGPMVAREMMRLVAASRTSDAHQEAPA